MLPIDSYKTKVESPANMNPDNYLPIGKGLPNMILVKEICYVNVENHFLTFTKHITFTRIILGTPFRNLLMVKFVITPWYRSKRLPVRCGIERCNFVLQWTT